MILLSILVILCKICAVESLSTPAGNIKAPSLLLSPNQRALANAPPFPRTWVPLASVYELDGARPNKVQFLGQSYVCYQNDLSDETSWTVVDDACPHRLAPLSEGRIINVDSNGNEIKLNDLKQQQQGCSVNRLIECSYHGWAFDKDGRCTRIPQATIELQQRTINNNSKCHVQSYSTHIVKNVIFAWLWPEDCLQFMQDEWRQPEHMLANLGDETTTYTRDLPYGWDTLLENIVDPAYVPWAHHGMQGTRNDAIAINMTTPSNVSEQGFSCWYQDRTMGKLRSGDGYFRAPFVSSFEGEFQTTTTDDKPLFNLTTILIPTKPGWSRIIIYGGPGSSGKRADTGESTKVTKQMEKAKKRKRSLFFLILSRLPTWVMHQFSSRFLDSDLAFLHYQEQERMKRQVDLDGYCIPAPADRRIAAMRKWITKYAHIPSLEAVAGKTGAEKQLALVLPASPMDRSVLFDHWSQHTDQCKHCHKALDGINTWRRNTFVIMGMSMLGKFLAARLVIVACLAVLRMLFVAERSMTKGGFDHYKNH
ncbi:hypothetical protein MPSEU_000768000 [Mayamaea pseudoterrestris]|nr:hypothetical protein MPSEU_000768000 [Mayamaea pseudoterrestris]